MLTFRGPCPTPLENVFPLKILMLVVSLIPSLTVPLTCSSPVLPPPPLHLIHPLHWIPHRCSAVRLAWYQPTHAIYDKPKLGKNHSKEFNWYATYKTSMKKKPEIVFFLCVCVFFVFLFFKQNRKYKKQNFKMSADMGHLCFCYKCTFFHPSHEKTKDKSIQIVYLINANKAISVTKIITQGYIVILYFDLTRSNTRGDLGNY